MYLRNQSDLSSASFLKIDIYNLELAVFFQLYLDGETGSILSLVLGEWPMMKYPSSAREIGRAFLDGLGLSYTEASGKDDGIYLSIFRLAGNETLYQVIKYDMGLWIYPDVDWELLEKEAQNGNISGSAAAGG